MSKIKEVRREAIAYLSITLFLWLIGILTPYISGLYIDFLITEISFKLLIWFVVVIAVIGSLQMFCRYFMSVASGALKKTRYLGGTSELSFRMA